MSNGLMTQLATTAFGSAAQTLKEETDRVLTDVEVADIQADNYVQTRIQEEANNYKTDRDNNLTKLTSRRDNFNRLLRKFGPEQIEELDLLEKSFPDLFEGDYSIVEQNVDNYIMSKTAPRITPTGSIFVAAEGGTAEKELDRTYDTSLIGVDRLNKNISDLTNEAAAGLAQYQGMNTADLFTSEFTKAGTRAEGVATRREVGADKQTVEQFETGLTNILNQKLATAPDAIADTELIRDINWTAYSQDFDTVYNAFRSQGLDDISAQSKTLAHVVRSAEMMTAMGMDKQFLAESGQLGQFQGRDTVAHFLLYDPAAQLTVQNMQELKKNPEVAVLFTNVRSINEGTFNGSEEEKTAIMDQADSLYNQTYSAARIEVSKTNFYNAQGEFRNAFSAIEYPEHLMINYQGNDQLIYPIPQDGLLKVLDGQNPDPGQAIGVIDIRSLIPVEVGGYPPVNQVTGETTTNFYYQTPDQGGTYNTATEKNERLDLLFAEVRANDPFGVGLMLTQQGSNMLAEMAIEQPDTPLITGDEEEVSTEKLLLEDQNPITVGNIADRLPPEEFETSTSLGSNPTQTIAMKNWLANNKISWINFMLSIPPLPQVEDLPATGFTIEGTNITERRAALGEAQREYQKTYGDIIKTHKDILDHLIYGLDEKGRINKPRFIERGTKGDPQREAFFKQYPELARFGD